MLSTRELNLIHKAVEHADSYGDCNIYPCRDRKQEFRPWDECFVENPGPDGEYQLQLWFNHETNGIMTTGMVTED